MKTASRLLLVAIILTVALAALLPLHTSLPSWAYPVLPPTQVSSNALPLSSPAAYPGPPATPMPVTVTVTPQANMPMISASARGFLRGGAVDELKPSVCGDLGLLNTWWYYNWNLTALTPDCSSTTPFIPMVWGHAEVAQIWTITDQSSSWLLGFNEPNYQGQAVMPPTDALDDWSVLEAYALAHDRKLVSPAVSACPGGLSREQGACNSDHWLEDFMALCYARQPSPCRIDALAVHYYVNYLPGADSRLRSYLSRRSEQYPQYPLWLTEWGYIGDETSAEAYMTAAAPVVRQYTERNSWFALYDYPVNGDIGLFDCTSGTCVLRPKGVLYRSISIWP